MYLLKTKLIKMLCYNQCNKTKYFFINTVMFGCNGYNFGYTITTHFQSVP